VSEVIEQKLIGNLDALVWSQEFVRLFENHVVGVNEKVDEGLMLSWFANAIMTGFDESQRRGVAIKKELDELRSFQELGMATRLGMYADVLKENARLREALELAKSHLSWLANDSVKYEGTDAWRSARKTLREVEALARDGAKQDDV